MYKNSQEGNKDEGEQEQTTLDTLAQAAVQHSNRQQIDTIASKSIVESPQKVCNELFFLVRNIIKGI